ncbi:peptide deformylase [Verrucomicrobiota bacterium sgz303538]
MIREIVKYGHPALRTKGELVGEVNDEIKKLAEDMLETMRHAHGVGLAAQQVAVPIQLAIVDVAGIDDRPSAMWIDGKEVKLEDYMPMTLLNPELTLGNEKERGTEGCLSFPDMSAEITRAAGVRCKARLLDGREIEFEAAGLLARALQHEVDHLHGVLFIDRMSSAAKAGLAGKLKRLQRETRA